ncbi:uroporphyrinogen-III C-methyltransferase [Undibacterium sp. TJN19]|uniref:uroporphyrinogen-III C-methyltransferase n=1 Tax=Undibacterium sp. TJN19 TaxID=3413055 RepID=UPI003BF0E507
MSEQQSNPEAALTANPVESTVRQPATPLPPLSPLSDKESSWANPAYFVSGVLAVLLAVNWWSSQNQITSLREEVAKRLLSADTNSSETKVLARNVQENAKEIQSKVILLEGKQSEAQSQQLALEQLYQDLSKNRDDWALAEIEQVLSTASQQLQLAGNVQGALIALQNADGRLAKSEKPQFISIRRAIAKDIERLKSLPALDLPGVALRLDSVITQIDHIPLWADEKSVVSATPPKAPLRVLPKSALNAKADKKPVVEEIEENTWSMRVQDAWQSFSSEMWNEVKQLIRVRNVETPDVLLLTPSQSYFARENLKLRLLNARLALLSRNESIFRSDMIAAQDAIGKYFDTRAKQTQTVQALLRQVQGSNLSIEMPTLAESLNAVRNYKVKP